MRQLQIALLFLTLFSWLILPNEVFSQNHHKRFELFDVQHYRFELLVNDTSQLVVGSAKILVRAKKEIEEITLDLVAYDSSTNRGMKVREVISHQPLSFSHKGDELLIKLGQTIGKNQMVLLTVGYEGVPSDGFIIKSSKLGNLTFFGDNWPDRAKNWLPTVDHPSDKAAVEFIVTAPKKFNVIGNGIKVSERDTLDSFKITHWQEGVSIPTKVMVVGIAPFNVIRLDSIADVPVSAWIYRNHTKSTRGLFAKSDEVMDFMIRTLGDYPYKKLAHVQSTTRYGGMENASNIFYSEKAMMRKEGIEFLIAHEVAHQWFGNSLSEDNWHHLWLSEGFATYLTHLYALDQYGEEIMQFRLEEDRVKVIDYYYEKASPIVDTTVTEYWELLNANSYQKASWVLHMLRYKIGHELFMKSIRGFYDDNKEGNANTESFRLYIEQQAGLDLRHFFQQWFYESSHPILALDWSQNNSGFDLKVEQQQEFLFQFPIDVRVEFEDGGHDYYTLDVEERELTQSLSDERKVSNVSWDPNAKLLFESIKD